MPDDAALGVVPEKKSLVEGLTGKPRQGGRLRRCNHRYSQRWEVSPTGAPGYKQNSQTPEDRLERNTDRYAEN